jgi:muramoyltetrapeptide carboxypeptidase LdcA involved in peptidoglycan recycling
VIGRFQKESEMTIEKLKFIVQTKDLKNIPIVANADFGHTKPMITFPIGGTSRLLVRNKEVNLEIISH